jgi:hypothetical protein
VSEISAEQFRSSFASVQPLIEQEWPSLDGKALAATGGDLDKVADLISAKTERTKVVIKRQLAELHAVANETRTSRIDAIKAMVDKLESRTTEIARKVREEMLPKAQEKVKENLLVSLLCALGLGLVIGFVLRMGTSRRGD